MSDLQTRDTLELEVKDFGPIVEARIDLRPLTVFVGPSNTGKSWLAILIYAMHRYFNGPSIFDSRRSFRWYRRFRDDRNREMSEKTIDSLIETASQISANRRRSMDKTHIAFPTPVAEEIGSVIDAKGEQLLNEIARCFGIHNAGGLIRKASSNGATIRLWKRRPDDSIRFKHELAIKSSKPKYETTVPPETSIRIDIEHGADEDYLRDVAEDLISTIDRKEDEDRDYYIWELVSLLAGYALPQFVEPLHLPAFYLPADRAGVMHAYKTVTSGLIGVAPIGGEGTAALGPTLTGFLADFLQQLIAFDYSPTGKSTPIQDISGQIEDAILGGTVFVEHAELTRFPYFTYRPKGWKDRLPLMNASSMVSELAPVVLYLRHLVQPGSVLIIEEPESSLHPAMQVEFIRQLAGLVRAGVRVIVTTHSEWVLEELANIVQRSALPDDRGKEVAGSEVALSPEEVGAWLFKPERRAKGSAGGAVVEEVRVDAEVGLYPTDYDEVREALYNENVRIFNRIQNGKSG